MLKSRVYDNNYELLSALVKANKKVDKLNRRLNIPIFRADIDLINNTLIVGDYFSLMKKNRKLNVYQYAKNYLLRNERIS